LYATNDKPQRRENEPVALNQSRDRRRARKVEGERGKEKGERCLTSQIARGREDTLGICPLYFYLHKLIYLCSLTIGSNIMAGDLSKLC